MRWIFAIFTLYWNFFWYFFQASEEDESDKNYDDDFKNYEPALAAEQF